MRYLSLTDSDQEAMLAAVGVSSIDELFKDIPASVRLDRPLDKAASRRVRCAESETVHRRAREGRQIDERNRLRSREKRDRTQDEKNKLAPQGRAVERKHERVGEPARHDDAPGLSINPAPRTGPC